ncbi:hypothetical protein MA16_Dca024959 [Dendrobium catenatum]|uniref:Uncharacterized protein n=1 Tax=Dendrobium catenatum TaxID=906689 RepID=A0A2I0VZ20_9ASPA|nr:hypothetical protein MA16_Dca024959 [Dendrobium catenatum]
MDEFQGLRVRHLSRLVSDHCPILCSIFAETKINYSPWFRFEDVWVNYPKARQLVMDKWNDGDHGSEAVQLQRKYSRTLKALFFWSRNKFKMINKQKDELDSEIQKLQELDREPGGLSEAQKEKLRFNVHLFNSTLARILMWWKQRAKVRWVEEGDGNTGFFHSMTSAQRRSKRIESIKREDGSEATEPGEITDIFFQFFNQKWKGQELWSRGGRLSMATREILISFPGYWMEMCRRKKF